MGEPNEMILKVAVAIARRRDAFGPGEKLAQGYLDDAREALLALRNPSDSMFNGIYGIEARRQFSWMIDEALK